MEPELEPPDGQQHHEHHEHQQHFYEKQSFRFKKTTKKKRKIKH